MTDCIQYVSVIHTYICSNECDISSSHLNFLGEKFSFFHDSVEKHFCNPYDVCVGNFFVFYDFTTVTPIRKHGI